MRGNSFGKMLSITSFGESHGLAMGVVVDGVPPGLKVSLKDLHAVLQKRAPGKVAGTSTRKELDMPEILSGVFNDLTLGTPIAVIVRNTNQKSSDYEKWKGQHRIGHGDETYEMKFGIRDYRGGGRASGRETIARVIGGYFAELVLPAKTKVFGFATRIGEFELADKLLQKIPKEYALPKELAGYLQMLQKEGDSVGANVRIIVDNPPKALGEPVFDKLKSDLGRAILSIGGCMAFSFGEGAHIVDLRGSEAVKDHSAFGGIEGGISNGRRIILDASFKPPSTVGEMAKTGRHDPCLVPRVIPVCEAMVKLVLADHYLRQKAYL